MKRNNLCIIKVPQKKEKKKGAENFFKDIMAENFPNLGDLQICEFMKLIDPPKILITKDFSSKYTIIKLSKIKEEENFITSKKKNSLIKESP